MSQTLTERDRGRAALASICEPIMADLAAVEALLRAELRSRHACVDELAGHAFRLGGKRLRPTLLLLAGQAVGELNADHHKLAAVVEMIHTATLVHDDILDEAEVRRHQATVNARWGNESSVLLGDYLFTHAFFLASTTSSTFACRTIGRATNITCEGELRQVHAAGDYRLAEDDYLGIIEAKTAELCACSCQLGAHFAGASDEVEQALTTYGRLIGIAFQIVDDLLDFLGDAETVGKSLGTDLEKRKATLPLIRLLERAEGERKRSLLDLLHRPGNHKAEVLSPLLAESGAIESARQTAADYIREAIAALDVLPASPARDALTELAEFVLTRQR